MNVWWNLHHDSTTSLYQTYLPYRQQNDCTTPKCGELSEKHWQCSHRGGQSFLNKYVWMDQMSTTDAGHDTRRLLPSWGAGRSSEVGHGAVGRRIDPSWGGPIELFLVPASAPRLVVCVYLVCGMVHIKEPLLLIDKSSLCGGSGFPFSLSEWSLTICLTPYNRKWNVLSASLNKTFLPSSFFLPATPAGLPISKDQFNAVFDSRRIMTQSRRKRSDLFNDALNTFYIRLYWRQTWLRTWKITREETSCCNYMGYSYWKTSKGSFICTFP